MPDKILLVEDHNLIAQGLQMALQAKGYQVASVVTESTKEVMARAEEFLPDLVLLDLQLGETTDGKELIAPLNNLGARVVMLTGVTDRTELAQCFEAGAAGVASKAESFDEVMGKITRALDGLPVNIRAERDEMLAELRRTRQARTERLAVFERLSPREREVFVMIMAGKSAEAISEESFVSLTTVRSQIRAILQKLGVNSQLAAVALARNAGWTPNGG